MDIEPVIIENLSFRYRSRAEPAIQNINLRVSAGQLVLIAGASGCGKTTLARCINGLIPRSYKGEVQGRILLQGQDTAALSLARISQLVGTVLQDPERQILGTRVANEVAFGLENLGLPRQEILQRVEQALDYLGISHLRDRETFNLSGGEKQKIALAGVLAMQPRILLLDEPLASLDPASAQEALALARRLADEGMTILMIEHRVEDVLSIQPDRALFMNKGQIEYDGPAEGLEKHVDYRQVKLPARLIMKMASRQPPPPRLEVLPGGKAKPENAAAPLVKFEDASFWYEPERPALEGVTLEIQRGDIIAVLGPNGAGKTTLVKHAIGLLKPKRGRVLVEGRDTRDLSVAQIAHTLGYVFQSPSHMLFAPTVYDELAFGPTNLGQKPQEMEQATREAIQIVNLEGLEKYPPLAMSFGQQKRVSIAAVLAMRSRILAMDEPTAGQDYQNYISFMEAILQMPGFEAILFITHDVDLAVAYSNRVLLVNQGRLVCDGSPYEVLKDQERLTSNRLVPTSLLRANLDFYPRTGRFMKAEELAHAVL
ncbi:MAG: ABC transporter ATP-binding protein [Anaerolineae bacterium]|nr:ABC transporter ATP-binding protein [Anaerolineae bacterium]